MTDITMCANGIKCRKRKTCYRFTAIPSEKRQSYSDFYRKGRKCGEYLKPLSEIEIMGNLDILYYMGFKENEITKLIKGWKSLDAVGSDKCKISKER